ncbi:DUF4229 domain-containing protein [Mycobacterium pseudokansasii]|uniref:DUF4229 domain-containing protein n=1 Tax=Mycobacterium pseudokansasii TaxID=2341080 RepID=A0A498QL37_9MYCO|nr:DUF4229 domain-containing protein [Mycobacterium pseudokansasii]VBA47423.1 hypothetical protein LAUMK142_00751 [Mycobacterium pseudokansasii]
MSAAPNGNSAEKTTGHRGVVDVALYATARLLLALVVTGVIYGVARLAGIAEFPVVVAALFGLTIAMPLGMWMFTPLRRRATAALAFAGERRRAERERLRARLRGENPDDPNSDQRAGEG